MKLYINGSPVRGSVEFNAEDFLGVSVIIDGTTLQIEFTLSEEMAIAAIMQRCSSLSLETP